MKARYGGVLLNVPGIEKQITIPAFTQEQITSALMVVKQVGNDFDLVYSLAGFVFEHVFDWTEEEENRGKIPPNDLYASWLRAFKFRENLQTRQIGIA